MCQRKPVFLCNYGHGHGRGEVVDDDYDVGRVGVKILLKLRHDTACKLIEVKAVDAEINIGRANAKIFKQGRLKRRVALSPGVHQAVVNILAAGLCLLDGTHQRSHLYEVRARSGYDTYIQHIHLFL